MEVQGTKPVQNQTASIATDLLVTAWEHCFRSKCGPALECLQKASCSEWERKLLLTCLEGMTLYHQSKLKESCEKFENLFLLHSQHQGVWTPLEQLKMDWVKKQYGETAHKISGKAYKELYERFEKCALVFDSPISPSDEGQRLLNDGRLKEAKSKCEEALRILEKQGDKYPGDVAREVKEDTINILVATKNFLCEFDEAEILARQVLENSKNPRIKVNLLRKLAEVDVFHKRFAQAQEKFNECLELIKTPPEVTLDIPLKFSTLLRQAIAYQTNGQFNQALGVYKNMLLLKENNLSPNEKTVLTWNVGALIYRADKKQVNKDMLEAVLEIIGCQTFMLDQAYSEMNVELTRQLLAPAWNKVNGNPDKKVVSEIGAYIPYGYDPLF